MCQFPSWIETRKKEILFLTDKEISPFKILDSIGHHAIEKHFGKKFPRELHLEGWPCPKPITKAINQGQMNKILKELGVRGLKINRNGWPTGRVVFEKGCTSSNVLKTEETYKNGKFHGFIRDWNKKSGKLEYSGEFKNGKEIRRLFADGQRYQGIKAQKKAAKMINQTATRGFGG